MRPITREDLVFMLNHRTFNGTAEIDKCNVRVELGLGHSRIEYSGSLSIIGQLQGTDESIQYRLIMGSTNFDFDLGPNAIAEGQHSDSDFNELVRIPIGNAVNGPEIKLHHIGTIIY